MPLYRSDYDGACVCGQGMRSDLEMDFWGTAEEEVRANNQFQRLSAFDSKSHASFVQITHHSIHLTKWHFILHIKQGSKTFILDLKIDF